MGVGVERTVIEVNRVSGEASGRFLVAQVVARVFPEYRSFAKMVLDGFELPVPSGPYPKDTLIYSGKTIVEFKTPAQTEGLGNIDSWIKKNDTPIVGAAILIVDPTKPIGDEIGNRPDLVLLSVRVPPDLAGLAPTIIRYVERNAAGDARK